jgi:hypothetical protein
MQHQFVSVANGGSRGRYLHLEQNPLALMFRLYRYGKPFGSRGTSFRAAIRGSGMLAAEMLRYSYYRKRLRNVDSVIELPIFGHLCLAVRNGYKVFDFDRQCVTKVFMADTGPTVVENEIETVRRVAEYEFAPSVIAWNVEERWYREEFVDGYTAKQEALVPVLRSLMLAEPARKVDAMEYLQTRRQVLHSPGNQLCDRQLDNESVDRVRTFVDTVIERLNGVADHSIYLVLSHGDFSARHVLKSDHGLVIVDWEAVGQRSALFDLYDSFFQRIVQSDGTSERLERLGVAIDQLIARLNARVEPKSRELALSLKAVDLYRLVYYVESITWFVGPSKRITSRGLEKLVRMVQTYQQFEQTQSVQSKMHSDLIE